MRDIGVRSVEEMLSVLRKLQNQFGSGNNPFIFRGHQNVSYQLLPGVYRNFKEPQHARLIEGGCIEGAIYRSNENEILAHFKKEACSVINSVPLSDDFTWLQYAQHYGVPTRLLDFTANPLIALYFCCRSETWCDGAVWVLNCNKYQNWMSKDSLCTMLGPDATGENIRKSIMQSLKGYSDYDPERIEMSRPLLFVPPFIDQRMQAQASRFLLWGADERPLEEMISEYEEMRLDPQGVRFDIVDDTRFLSKLVIPDLCKHDILNELDVLGVNEKSVFPGLDGIGKYIERYYRNNPDDILQYI